MLSGALVRKFCMGQKFKKTVFGPPGHRPQKQNKPKKILFRNLTHIKNGYPGTTGGFESPHFCLQVPQPVVRFELSKMGKQNFFSARNFPRMWTFLAKIEPQIFFTCNFY